MHELQQHTYAVLLKLTIFARLHTFSADAKLQIDRSLACLTIPLTSVYRSQNKAHKIDSYRLMDFN